MLLEHNDMEVGPRVQKSPEEVRQMNRARGRRFYHNHKDELNTRYQCAVCGGYYTKQHKTKHQRTLKHQRAAEQSPVPLDDLRQ